MSPSSIIARKRDGHALTEAEIRTWIRGLSDGTFAPYQTSALLMAIYLRGMNHAETAWLTRAMLESGASADLSTIALPKVDKHSTGGVGDKVSLVLAPLVAACGVAVPMISGRGLGHTGGTLDKLESIPGFSISQSLEDFRRITETHGFCLIGQTAEICPADKTLYALRDVTGTVESIPLICGSILSKKFAEGIDALVLDVKFGRGAFMSELARAKELALAMIGIGEAMGKPVRALLTRMDEPLGHAIGNALEVEESIVTLRGGGPPDLLEVTMALGVEMLLAAGKARDAGDATKRLYDALASGRALARFRDVIAAQGGDARIVDDTSLLPQARVRVELHADAGGYVSSVDAMEVAMLVLDLGAGRKRAEDRVDPAVGISGLVKVGQRVRPGMSLGCVHASSEAQAADAIGRLRSAIRLSPQPVTAPPLVLGPAASVNL